MPTVEFCINCFEHNYRLLLSNGYLKELVDSNDYKFDRIILSINDVNDKNDVFKMAKALVDDGSITHFYFIEDCSEKVLSFFDLDKAKLGKGYVYGIPQWAAIYNAMAEYVVYWSPDCKLNAKCNWINQGIDIIKSNPNIVVANPVWNNNYPSAKGESFAEFDGYYLGYGFSDQVFMIPTAPWRAKIYNQKNQASERYPVYAGELFEKQADAWMRNNSKYRATLKSCYWIHPVHPPPAEH